MKASMMNFTASHILESAAIVGALLIAQGADPSDWVAFIERIGLAAALVLFFVWQNWYTSWNREKRMSERIDFLEQVVDKLSVELARLTSKVTEAMDHETTAVDRAMEILGDRPCFAFPNRDLYEQWKAERREKRQNGSDGA